MFVSFGRTKISGEGYLPVPVLTNGRQITLSSGQRELSALRASYSEHSGLAP